MKRLSYLTAVLSLVLCGCAEEKFAGRQNLPVVSGVSMPVPVPSDLVTPPRPYLISPYDRLDISVFGIPELSRTLQVDPTGAISLPLVGTLSVTGVTSDQLAETIAERLRGKSVRDPLVSVNLTEAASQLFTVTGDVQSPGLYPIIGRMTLMRAVAKGGGTSEFARESYVVVFRRVKDQDVAGLYDLRAIRQGLYEDPEIYANDVVMIGDSRARRTFKDVASISGLVVAPIVTILNNRR